MKQPALRIVMAALVALAAASAGFYVRHETTAPGDAAAAEAAREKLLALALPDAVSGAPQNLAQWRGRVLVVNFWATWCAPCRKEIPAFAAQSRALAHKGVQFVGISIDSPQNVRAFQQEMQVPYPLLIAPPDALQLTAPLGNAAQGLPFTVILDRSGAVRHVKLGAFSETDLAARLQALDAS